uniref:Uncharacterized protein n=1 Tax=Zooxanthella nutricula TaxID=1333877 RepID=A0A7S2NUQ9_9DINO
MLEGGCAMPLIARIRAGGHATHTAAGAEAAAPREGGTRSQVPAPVPFHESSGKGECGAQRVAFSGHMDLDAGSCGTASPAADSPATPGDAALKEPQIPCDATPTATALETLALSSDAKAHVPEPLAPPGDAARIEPQAAAAVVGMRAATPEMREVERLGWQVRARLLAEVAHGGWLSAAESRVAASAIAPSTAGALNAGILAPAAVAFGATDTPCASAACGGVAAAETGGGDDEAHEADEKNSARRPVAAGQGQADLVEEFDPAESREAHECSTEPADDDQCPWSASSEATGGDDDAQEASENAGAWRPDAAGSGPAGRVEEFDPAESRDASDCASEPADDFQCARSVSADLAPPPFIRLDGFARAEIVDNLKGAHRAQMPEACKDTPSKSVASASGAASGEWFAGVKEALGLCSTSERCSVHSTGGRSGDESDKAAAENGVLLLGARMPVTAKACAHEPNTHSQQDALAIATSPQTVSPALNDPPVGPLGFCSCSPCSRRNE